MKPATPMTLARLIRTRPLVGPHGLVSRSGSAAMARDGVGEAPAARADAGFTLTEVLVSLALFGLCLTAILPTFFAAKIRIEESQQEQTASLLLDDYYNEFLGKAWEEIGSTALVTGPLNPDGEWILRHRVNENGERLILKEDGSIMNASAIPPSYRSQSGRESYKALFPYEVDVKVYYNRAENPYMKYVRMEIRYVPYARRLKNPKAAINDPDQGVNIKRIRRFIPVLQTVDYPE